MARLLDKPAPYLFNFTYGLFSWLLFLFFLTWNGAFFKRTTEKEGNDLAIERNKLWDLSKSWSGFKHYFLRLRHGLKIHYVCNDGPDSATAKTKPLFIFIHGFPDSWALWRYILTSELRSTCILVAFDLPGYGGSDSMTRYGATEVFEALSEFILEIRELYGFDTSDGDNEGRKVYIVGHDWGCALGCRLASEAPCLADRFILSNAPLPQLLADNADRMSSSAGKMFRMFLHHPISSRALLRKSIAAIQPLLRQMRRSGYAFAFQLPNPFIRFLGTGASFGFLKVIHRLAFGKVGAYTPHDAAEAMASTIGPSLAEAKTLTDSKETYPESVSYRAKTCGEFFIHQTAYYRDEAIFAKWNKSLETIAGLHTISEGAPRRRSSSSGGGLFPNGDRKSLNQKSTFVWGQKDGALVESLVLQGIGDYLPQGSQVVVLPRSNHFTPIERESRAAFERVLEWVAGGEKENLAEIMEESYHGAVVTVQK